MGWPGPMTWRQFLSWMKWRLPDEAGGGESPVSGPDETLEELKARHLKMLSTGGRVTQGKVEVDEDQWD